MASLLNKHMRLGAEKVRFAPTFRQANFAPTYSGPSFSDGEGQSFNESKLTDDVYLRTLIAPAEFPFPTPDTNMETVVCLEDTLNSSLQVKTAGSSFQVIVTPRVLDFPVKIANYNEGVGEVGGDVTDLDKGWPCGPTSTTAIKQSAPFSRNYGEIYEAGRTTSLVTTIQASTITAGTITLSGNYTAVASESLNNFSTFDPNKIVNLGITTKDELTLRPLFKNPMMIVHGPEIVGKIRPFPSPSTWEAQQVLKVTNTHDTPGDNTIYFCPFCIKDGTLPDHLYRFGGELSVFVAATQASVVTDVKRITPSLIIASSPIANMIKAKVADTDPISDKTFVQVSYVEQGTPSAAEGHGNYHWNMYPGLQGGKLTLLDANLKPNDTDYDSIEVPIGGINEDYKTIAVGLKTAYGTFMKEIRSELLVNTGYDENHYRPATVVAMSELSASTLINITATRLTEAIPGGQIAPDVKARVFRAGTRSINEMNLARNAFSSPEFPLARIMTFPEAKNAMTKLSLGSANAITYGPEVATNARFGDIGNTILGGVAKALGSLIPFSGDVRRFANESDEECDAEVDRIMSKKRKRAEVEETDGPSDSGYSITLSVKTKALTRSFSIPCYDKDDREAIESECMIALNSETAIAENTGDGSSSITLHAEKIEARKRESYWKYLRMLPEPKDLEDIKEATQKLTHVQWHKDAMCTHGQPRRQLVFTENKEEETPPRRVKVNIKPVKRRQYQFASGDSGIGVVFHNEFKRMGKVTPKSTVNFSEALFKCENKTTQRIGELVSGKSRNPKSVDAKWGYCKAPSVINAEDAGMLATILCTPDPVAKEMSVSGTGETQDIATTYEQIEVTYWDADYGEKDVNGRPAGGHRTGMIYIDEAMLGNDEPTTQIITACAITSQFDVYFTINFDDSERASGGSIGLAALFAAAAINHPRIACTGRLAWGGDDKPAVIEAVGYVLGKGRVCEASDCYLIGARGRFTDTLINSTGHEEALTTTAQLWSNVSDPGAILLRCETTSDALLMAYRVALIASKKAAPGGISMPQEPEVVAKGNRINREVIAMREATIQELEANPEAHLQEFPIDVGKRQFQARLLDYDWWKQYAPLLKAAKIPYRSIPEKIRAGMLDKLKGYAIQALSRAQKQEKVMRPPQPSGSKRDKFREQTRQRLAKAAKMVTRMQEGKEASSGTDSESDMEEVVAEERDLGGAANTEAKAEARAEQAQNLVTKSANLIAKYENEGNKSKANKVRKAAEESLQPPSGYMTWKSFQKSIKSSRAGQREYPAKQQAKKPAKKQKKTLEKLRKIEEELALPSSGDESDL